MTAVDKLPVAEVFGPTLQGEGPSAGRPAVFLRFGHCNLACSWCDTPYTWDQSRFDLAAEITDRPVSELLVIVDDAQAPLVVLTGGEPLLQAKRPAFAHLLAGLRARDLQVEVETNGTIPPPRHLVDVASFNVSPKLSNAGMPTTTTMRPRALQAYAALAQAGRAVFKLVVSHPDELNEVDTLVSLYDLPPSAVWIMPEGTQPGPLLDLARVLVDEVTARGWNLTPRLHALLWPEERNR